MALIRSIDRVDPRHDHGHGPDRVGRGWAAQQLELERLSRELHDVVGQDLTAIQLSLLAARGVMDRDELTARLDASLALTDAALADVRSIAMDVRPTCLDGGGLTAALERYLAAQQRSSGVTISLSMAPVRRLAGPVELAAYRIVQEAVTNAIRHASPRRISVRLSVARGRLLVRVDDDGRGFDVPRALAARTSLGLAGMFERATLSGGRIRVSSRPSRGTHVSVRFASATQG